MGARGHEAWKDLVFYMDKAGYVNDGTFRWQLTPLASSMDVLPLKCTQILRRPLPTNSDLFHVHQQIGMSCRGVRYPSFPLVKWAYPGRALSRALTRTCVQLGSALQGRHPQEGVGAPPA